MKRERVRPSRPEKKAEPVEELIIDDAAADLLRDIDELLDEIDTVLEDQAVLVGYRQRSGE